MAESDDTLRPPGSHDAADSGGFEDALASLGGEMLRSLHALELAFRFLDPGRGAELRDRLAALAAPLSAARRDFRAVRPPGLEAFHERFASGAEAVARSLESLTEPAPPAQAAARTLAAMHLHARAQETLYPLRHGLPPLDRYFAEAALHGDLGRLAPRTPAPSAPSLGLHRAGGTTGERERFTLYVPEWLDERPRPLVVALHGAMGSGRDFVWTWLREARSRGFLLLAPSSRGATWSLPAPALDAKPLREMVAFVCERWPVARDRILLTGLSDGGTFALLVGLGQRAPFTHLAPVAGVLHPSHFALGNLARARDRRIYWVHGARDWLFPSALARAGADALSEAGAELVYRELADLAHAYPREENDAILRWLDPALVPLGTS